MAFFRRKGGDSSSPNGDGGADGGLNIQPEKAHAWFRQARTAADTQNYPYAIQCYLNGLKFDPTNVESHKALLEIAGLYRARGGKPASGREIREMLGEKKPTERLAAAELAWVTDATDNALNLKFITEAAGLGLTEVAYWGGEWGVNALARNKKPSKNAFVEYVDLFERIGAYEMAVRVGEIALAMDRTDAKLQARIRNLSAQATMDKGRYDQNVGQEGSFRTSIRDAKGQQERIEDESLAAGEEAVARRIARAKAEYEAKPTDPVVIARYGDLLAKSGDEALEAEAIRVYRQGFKDTSEYRFRVLAGDLMLVQARRKLRSLRDKAEQTGDPTDAARVAQGAREILEREVMEYRERVEKYPTDTGLRFTLGEKLFEAGQYDDAIPILQEARSDARHRARSDHLLGLAFLRKEWFDEAVDSLRAAVDGYELKDDDTHLAMRYDLMLALEAYARENRDLKSAEEAFEHSKHIAMRQIKFRDIAQKRDATRQLVKELRGS